ncbi:MAG: hypothetical protein H6767_08780 [Candidatus Peribacteria bacterium]|nr:MAG: hypothetical protein H6767_08780 [Candidatus Peribacteria bacterium]
MEYRHLNEERARDFIARIYEKLQHEDTEKAYRIDRSLSPIKRYHQYHFHIMIRGENIRQFLGSIKDEILRNKGLIVKFGE